MAYLTHSEVAAVDFYSQGEQSEGLLMAPALRRAKNAGSRRLNIAGF